MKLRLSSSLFVWIREIGPSSVIPANLDNHKHLGRELWRVLSILIKKRPTRMNRE